MKWFKHDSDARSDAKLERVMIKYGLTGYGLYFYCLELIASGVEKTNLTFELEHDSELIAHRVGIHSDLVSEMIAYMCNLGLFENNRGTVTCLKMATRTDEYTQKLINNNKTLPTLSRHTPDTLPIMSELIEENRTEKKRPKTTRRFSPPTLQEVRDYVKTRQVKINPDAFIDFYESKGWMIGKTKCRDWKACVRTWEQRKKETGKDDPPAAQLRGAI